MKKNMKKLGFTRDERDAAHPRIRPFVDAGWIPFSREDGDWEDHILVHEAKGWRMTAQVFRPTLSNADIRRRNRLARVLGPSANSW